MRKIQDTSFEPIHVMCMIALLITVQSVTQMTYIHHRGKKFVYYVAWCRISALFLTVTMCINSLFLTVNFNFYEPICIVSAHLILNLSKRLCSL